jgi:hypothetical protein
MPPIFVIVLLVCALCPAGGFPMTEKLNVGHSAQAVRKSAAGALVAVWSSSSPTTPENFTSSTSNGNKNVKDSSTRYIASLALMEATNKKNLEFPLRRLENDKRFQTLDVRDRGFTRLLVSTVERRKGQIDKVLGHCMNSPSKPPVSCPRPTTGQWSNCLQL